MLTKHDILMFALLLAVVLPLEMLAAFAAYETLGEICQILYLFSMLLNLPLLAVAFRFKTVAALGILALAVAIIPYQVYLRHRYYRVQQEAARIVTYVYEQKLSGSAFPADLSGYSYHDPEMPAFIQHYELVDGGQAFALYYRIGTENTSHSYVSNRGWGYYPD